MSDINQAIEDFIADNNNGFHDKEGLLEELNFALDLSDCVVVPKKKIKELDELRAQKEILARDKGDMRIQIQDLKRENNKLQTEYETLKEFCYDFQMFAHAELVCRKDRKYWTFQDMRVAAYTYRVNEGHEPKLWGCKDYLVERFLGLEGIETENLKLKKQLDLANKLIIAAKECFMSHTTNSEADDYINTYLKREYRRVEK